MNDITKLITVERLEELRRNGGIVNTDSVTLSTTTPAEIAALATFALGMPQDTTMVERSDDGKVRGFQAAAQPLIKWLAEHVHPNHTVIVSSTHAELLATEISFTTTDYLMD
ncbi:hypothetical protein [Serratia fonticola]|uniref:hypothetical protein n=1 Tax=Serratia fonticola TaxID=47917 RepID=UPI00301D435C